jgi:hypothetical protein
LADESVPAEDAALLVDPVIAEATAPILTGAGVVDVNVPKALALRPHRTASCWLVAVPDWPQLMRTTRSTDALEEYEVAARSVIISESAMTVWFAIVTV